MEYLILFLKREDIFSILLGDDVKIFFCIFLTQIFVWNRPASTLIVVFIHKNMYIFNNIKKNTKLLIKCTVELINIIQSVLIIINFI